MNRLFFIVTILVACCSNGPEKEQGGKRFTNNLSDIERFGFNGPIRSVEEYQYRRIWDDSLRLDIHSNKFFNREGFMSHWISYDNDGSEVRVDTIFYSSENAIDSVIAKNIKEGKKWSFLRYAYADIQPKMVSYMVASPLFENPDRITEYYISDIGKPTSSKEYFIEKDFITDNSDTLLAREYYYLYDNEKKLYKIKSLSHTVMGDYMSDSSIILLNHGLLDRFSYINGSVDLSGSHQIIELDKYGNCTKAYEVVKFADRSDSTVTYIERVIEYY